MIGGRAKAPPPAVVKTEVYGEKGG